MYGKRARARLRPGGRRAQAQAALEAKGHAEMAGTEGGQAEGCAVAPRAHPVGAGHVTY